MKTEQLDLVQETNKRAFNMVAMAWPGQRGLTLRCDAMISMSCSQRSFGLYVAKLIITCIMCGELKCIK